jgi:3-methyladenine DNA glycosylase AlkD
MAAPRNSKKTVSKPKSGAWRVDKPAAQSAAKSKGARLSLAETMRALEQAGSAQFRKTFARYGAQEPMFGVSFAELKALVKQIGVDHELALGLWGTGNHDARVLAMKVADPARMKSGELDRWAKQNRMRMCGGYVAMLAAEGPHGAAKAREWLASGDASLRTAGWNLVGCLANLDEETPDDWFARHLERIETSIHSAPNLERDAMNMALIAIGGRSAQLRKTATAAAKRIGKVEIDQGDTACKTPDAAAYIEKTWAHAKSKEFASPAAQERAREPMRTRC